MGGQRFQSKIAQSDSVWTGLLPYIPFCLPLLYLRPFAGFYNTALYRSATVIAFGLFATVLLKRRFNKKSQFKFWQFLVLGLLAMMLISFAFSKDKIQALFGITGDFQGLLLQLSALLLAYQASRKTADSGYWQRVAKITGAVCILSVIFALPGVLQSYRLTGLVLHATGVSLYAAVALGINLLVWIDKTSTSQSAKYWYLANLTGIIGVLVLSASRIGLLAALATIAFIAFFERKAWRSAIITSALLIVLTFIGGKLPTPIQRVSDSSRVAGGVSYRLQLYRWSLQLAGSQIVGVGPSQVDRVLVPRPDVPTPSVIQHTLDENFVFWYSHNQFIDYYIQYGIIGGALFAALVLVAGGRLIKLSWQSRRHKGSTKFVTLAAGCVFIPMFSHLAINTPSIELYSLVFLGLFICLRLGTKNKS